ncbi:glycoside hydrolase superfamily [Abortiporus biennis]|nr:glycoside hydrolase superfamily [Abortiporus biennis]
MPSTNGSVNDVGLLDHAAPEGTFGTSGSRGSKLTYEGSPYAGEEQGTVYATGKKPLYKRPVFWFLGAAVLAAIIVAAVVPAVIVTRNNNNLSASGASHDGGHSSSNSGTSTSSSSTPSGTPTPQQLTRGGDGSTVTKSDGTTFTYVNKFGGIWVDDPNNPLDNSAQCNSWTPPLNTTWDWGQTHINGVNLGGWFVLEPFISPSIYQNNPGASDEWSLSTILSGKNNMSVLEDHYNTFITEEDIAQIAGAGLNWLRVPIPFWAIETWNDVGKDDTGNTVAEPFAAGVAWPYILRLFQWARKYGLRINLDLHTMPGSQNGYNHSGKGGMVNFLNGPMGIANAQRALDYIRLMLSFADLQPEWSNVVAMFGIVNEPLVNTIGADNVRAFYYHAYTMIRGITGTGKDKGPFISFHDGFAGIGNWAGFLSGADRIALDEHPYFAFNGQPNDDPVNIPATGNSALMGGKWPAAACGWGSGFNTSRTAFGVTVGGEWSLAMNDCGLFVNGVTNTHSSAADCTMFSDATTWDANTKKGIMTFALASMDALQDWFFWTWKIGNSTAGKVEAPLWSYQLGLQLGYMPTDPRQSVGICASLGVSGNQFDGTYSAWQTGGAGAGQITAATAGFDWPPAQVSNAGGAALPVYTATKSVVTLPPPTFTPAPKQNVAMGNGWFDSGDNTPMVTAVSGCAYVDAWSAVGVAVPTACGAGGAGAAAPAATDRR